jgi:hypothetical protein
MERKLEPRWRCRAQLDTQTLHERPQRGHWEFLFQIKINRFLSSIILEPVQDQAGTTSLYRCAQSRIMKQAIIPQD